MDLIRPHDNMLKYSYVHRTHFIVFIYHPIISMHFVIFISIFLHMLYHVSVSLSEVTDTTHAVLTSPKKEQYSRNIKIPIIDCISIIYVRGLIMWDQN